MTTQEQPKAAQIHRRQPFLPQTEQEQKEKKQSAATNWEDAYQKKVELENRIREYNTLLGKLSAAREKVDSAAHAYYHAIPVTDGTLYSECPFSPRKIDRFMGHDLFKRNENLFRWLAPRTLQSPTELKTFMEEMLPALDWGMKMKAFDEKLKQDSKPKISPENPAEIF